MDAEQIKGWSLKLTKIYCEIIEDKSLSINPCLIKISPLSHCLGEWNRAFRTITIALETLATGSYEDILHVLKHEMAHQVVDELFCRSGKPHGSLFKQACELLGISSSATFSLNDLTRDPVFRKIEKLMALSQSSNENEAMAALAKAQELSFKYNVDLLNTEKNQYNLRPLGKIRKRTASYEWTLINILTEFYFVKALHVYHNIENELHWQFEIYGTPGNIDSAEYVYFFLLNQSELLWKTYLKKNGRAVSRKRNLFMNGLFEGFKGKLSTEREELKNKYAVIHLEDPRLDSFFKERNPRIRTRKIAVRNDGNVFDDGVKDGKNIRVRPGIAKNRNSPPVAYLGCR